MQMCGERMNKVFIAILASVVLGYALGCINLSYIISRMNGFDIRKYGSGNAGASNTMIVMGRKTGLIVAILDILKAFVAVKLAGLLFGYATIGNANYAECVSGVCAILGHIFPFYMKFKGGKGLAAFGGTILALDASLFVILFIIAVLIALITDYICFVPISMALIFPISFGYFNKSLPCMGILFVASIFIWYRHMENIRRIRKGEEARFSLLWNRGREADRFGIPDDGKSIFDHEIKKEDSDDESN